jgi:hypothetical protein
VGFVGEFQPFAVLTGAAGGAAFSQVAGLFVGGDGAQVAD